MKTLTITHNAGFFSCCSIKLEEIIKYFNNNKRLPDIVDSSNQFEWYKKNRKDVTYDYFNHYSNYDNIIYTKNIEFDHEDQFINYTNVRYTDIQPFINKYFSPSNIIKNNITEIEKKYSINYDNTCVLFYRGNDKNRETKICSYNEYITYANKILEVNPNIQFLIQSDETEFINKMLAIYPNNSYYFKDEIRHMNKCNNTVDLTQKNNIEKYSQLYLAITIIMSKCKYIICGSGNCSIWIMFYRGNNTNVYQNLDGNWILN